jgi:hypothetical protein
LGDWLNDAEDCRPGCLISWYENDAINARFDEEVQHMGENAPCAPNVLLGINLDKPTEELDRQVKKVFGHAASMLESLASAAKIVETIRDTHDEYSVKIGSTQDFRLSRALLVYGKTSYDAFPYRHPFIVVHDVIHDDDGARLAEGQLVTPQMLIDLMVGLGQRAPIEILPDRVIVRTLDSIVWWTPAQERIMFFSDRGNDAGLKKMNGKHYPHPPLLFKTAGTHLSVRALLNNKRPTPETKL